MARKPIKELTSEALYGRVQGLIRKRKNAENMSKDDSVEMDMKPVFAIRLCLSNKIMFNIKGEKTMVELWARLVSLYQDKSLVDRIFLKKRLYSLKMKGNAKILDHLN
ncbi:Retrovirus-related Pol polyprotein from transposon TNT 1-94-like protein [Drosera capensis]